MYYPIENGSVYEIPDNAFGFIYKCQLPPVGYGVNVNSGKLQETDIIKRSDIPEEQYWERYVLPSDFKSRRKIEKDRQKFDKFYFDPYLENIRRREWKRRLCGVWFWNYNPSKGESELLYITGTHYFYATYWKFQGKHMDFRINDMECWYIIRYLEENPNALGVNEITKRKLGKTARLGCWLYERTSRRKNKHAGLQSKADDDAEEVMKKAIVQPWQKLPDFFRPIYDTMKGDDPKELRFFHTSRKGASTEEEIEEEALESWIDFGSSGEAVYDGPELDSYGSDESGKCFGIGTKIRMYNGAVKNVEDIQNGEFVMGDDSTPRLVSGVTRGEEEMFRIIPKKGYSWECNKSHILSLKWCTKYNQKRGWSKYDVVNISVDEFLKLRGWERKHLMLYKLPVSYKEVKHSIEPYFLGLWLGDGSKSNVEIATVDSEVIDYIGEFAASNGLSVNNVDGVRYYLSKPAKRSVSGIIDGVDYKFSSIYEANSHFGYNKDTQFEKTKLFKDNNFIIDKKVRNCILDELHRLNVIKNKHIPNDFLIDSEKNRLDLLAGLVDSDGHVCLSGKSKLPKGIEITQKIKLLAEQIHSLAISLGFYSSICPKVARMKRLDGTVYECNVYRVSIYGDLWKIPTKVKRKQVPKINFHVNRRNPAHSGFKIISIGVGKYYGFAVNKNSLFLLEDGTVVHNTKKPVSIKERQNVTRYCAEIDGEFGGRKQWYTTTVEIEPGEEMNYDFQDMTANSNPLELDANGRTGTGLYTYFLPAQKGMFFDRYGYPDEKRALQFLNNTIAAYEAKGDLRGLSSFKRKNPRNFKEAFSVDGTNSLYNPEILNRRLDEIEWTGKLTERGDLVWKDGFKIKRPTNEFVNGERLFEVNEILWVPNANGRFERVAGWKPKVPNMVTYDGQSYAPNNPYLAIGCDPFRYDKTKDKRRSNCAAYAYQIPEPMFPDRFDDTFVLSYVYRADSTRESNEDMLKMAWYCGSSILFERQVNHWKNDFRDWECARFYDWLPGEVEPGVSASTTYLQDLCNYSESYINQHIGNVWFKELIRKDTGWLGFKVEDTETFDRPMAAGITLIKVKGQVYRSQNRVLNISDFFASYNN